MAANKTLKSATQLDKKLINMKTHPKNLKKKEKTPSSWTFWGITHEFWALKAGKDIQTPYKDAQVGLRIPRSQTPLGPIQNQRVAGSQHPPFHKSLPLWLSAAVGSRGPGSSPWLSYSQQLWHPSPFPGEGKEPATHLRQGLIREQDWEGPTAASTTIFLSFSKCSHLWGRPTDSSSQQVWWIRVDRGLFYTEFLHPNVSLASTLCFPTKSLLCFPPAATPARKSSQQPPPKCLCCLSSSQPSKSPEPPCKQTACQHLNSIFPERHPQTSLLTSPHTPLSAIPCLGLTLQLVWGQNHFVLFQCIPWHPGAQLRLFGLTNQVTNPRKMNPLGVNLNVCRSPACVINRNWQTLLISSTFTDTF